jgi:hypothetical protein
MASRRPVVLVAAILALAGRDAGAQSVSPGFDRYSAQFGEPIDASLDDLVNTPSSYIGRAVRTKGFLEIASMDRTIQPALRSTFGVYVLLTPVSDVSFEWEQQAKTWYGKEVEITGLFQPYSSSTGATSTGALQGSYQIVFWAYIGPPEKTLPKDLKTTLISLEELVSRPGKYDGKAVHVVGKFRGRNLYGDLPAKSERNSSDWVIKDDLYAVWVTGRKPKGDGWALDANLKRDTGKWMDVVGRPTTVGNVTYVQALQVVLGAPPKPNADAAPPPPPPERPKVPPVVVFSLPLDGDREVPPTGRFAVQFSKDMNEESFKGRVVLRYVGRVQPGDRDFDAAKVTYDGGRRALIIDPGDVMRSGRVVELILLPGIVDIDGMALEPRPGKQVGQAAEVLRYQVAF